MKKVRASEQKRNQIKTILTSGSREAIEDLHRLGQEKFLQELLEGELDEHLCRE
jgi:hypothetical protein